MHEPSLAQQSLIGCDKILFSHTQRGYQFLFLNYFIIFRFFFLFFVCLFLLLLFYYIFFHENYFYFFHVPVCSGMFRNVPACSGMFHVPDFIDGRRIWPSCDSSSAADVTLLCVSMIYTQKAKAEGFKAIYDVRYIQLL